MNYRKLNYLPFALWVFPGLVLHAENALASGAESEPAVVTVASVDLTQYIGRWYEIARIPNRFQKTCASNTTADYAIRGDGRLDVINRCIRKDGSLNEASGIARITDDRSNAKLAVSFVSFLGWRPFWGDYWVIGLDEFYQWAIVGHPSREYGWVLARKPEVDEVTLAHIFTIIERNGYQRGSFELTLHRMNTARY